MTASAGSLKPGSPCRPATRFEVSHGRAVFGPPDGFSAVVACENHRWQRETHFPLAVTDGRPPRFIAESGAGAGRPHAETRVGESSKDSPGVLGIEESSKDSPGVLGIEESSKDSSIRIGSGCADRERQRERPIGVAYTDGRPSVDAMSTNPVTRIRRHGEAGFPFSVRPKAPPGPEGLSGPHSSGTHVAASLVSSGEM